MKKQFSKVMKVYISVRVNMLGNTKIFYIWLETI